MITDEDYAVVAADVYDVDPLKKDPPRKSGERYSTLDSNGVAKAEFTVLETSTNPLTGFQGMAAVPFTDGEPDFSTVYIAFAGTNPAERADIVADLVSVVGGNTGSGTQVADAERFAKHVEARLNEEGHSGATIETVGHSLGGFLAMHVAAENQWKSTTFNGPDPWRTLSAEAKEWLESERALGRRPFTNYVNQLDVIGNSLGHGTGAVVFVADDPAGSLLDHHDLLTAFGFGTSGEMMRVAGSGLTMSELSSLIDSVSPGQGQALKVVDAVVSSAVGTAAIGAGAALSGLIVAVDTMGALTLAATVGGVATHLKTIKDVNEGLVPEMTAGFTNAKNAATQLYPWITEADIEACVSTHDLHVSARIDESAVAAVSDLVGDHLVMVAKISDGVQNAVASAVAQDAQWAAAYGLGSNGGR